MIAAQLMEITTMTYEIGQKFVFFPGQKVICNGYPGTVRRMYYETMVEVRMERGEVCVSACFPDCYPAVDNEAR